MVDLPVPGAPDTTIKVTFTPILARSGTPKTAR
jgi:hypothetical protein